MTLLADVVAASRDVTSTSSRSRKVAILAELLGRLDAREVPIAVGFLTGMPRHGRVGISYSTGANDAYDELIWSFLAELGRGD
jgi:DNA ligase 1